MKSALALLLVAFAVSAYASPLKVELQKLGDAMPSQAKPLRRYTSGGSGVSPTAAPTTAPAPEVGSKSISQPVTLSITAAQYTGNTKALYEQGYGSALGIFDATSGQYQTGCSVTSTVARRSAQVTYTAQVSAALAVAAEAVANNMVSDPSLLVAGMTAVKAGNTATYGFVSVPTASDLTVTAPQVTTASSASSVAASWCVAAGVALLALRH